MFGKPKTHCMTLYVLKSDHRERANHKRLIYSFRGLLDQVTVLEDRRLDKIKETRNKWWGYMFDSEYIDQRVRMALPIFFANEQYSYYNLFKKVLIAKEDEAEVRVFSSPRIFQDHVQLKEGSEMVPLNIELPHTAILDGWILEDEWSQDP